MRADAEFWNTAGRLARWTGDRLSQLHLWLYGISGNFDARSDTAGYWNWHKPETPVPNTYPTTDKHQHAFDPFGNCLLCAECKR